MKSAAATLHGVAERTEQHNANKKRRDVLEHTASRFSAAQSKPALQLCWIVPQAQSTPLLSKKLFVPPGWVSFQ